MLVLERSPDRTAVEQPPVDSDRRGGSWLGPVLAMAAGLGLIAGALVVVDQARTKPASSTMTIGGPADVTVHQATYQPGQTSGWHAHTGIHAVMVLSGTVTMYDGGCQGRAYGPGETYVGGREVHTVTNETAEPVTLSVTYLFPAGVSHTTFHVDMPAPAGCGAR
jgi:quercetin dioxygenase-like cupin family protein